MEVKRFIPAFDLWAKGEIFWDPKFDFRVGLVVSGDPNLNAESILESSLEILGHFGKASEYPKVSVKSPHSGGICSAEDCLVESVPLGFTVKGSLLFIQNQEREKSIPLIYLEAESPVETNGSDILLYWDKEIGGVFRI